MPVTVGWLSTPRVLQVVKLLQTRPSPLPAPSWSKVVPCRGGLIRPKGSWVGVWGSKHQLK